MNGLSLLIITERRIARSLYFRRNEVRSCIDSSDEPIPAKMPTYCIVLISKQTPGDLYEMRTGKCF